MQASVKSADTAQPRYATSRQQLSTQGRGHASPPWTSATASTMLHVIIPNAPRAAQRLLGHNAMARTNARQESWCQDAWCGPKLLGSPGAITRRPYKPRSSLLVNGFLEV